jgi:hypothetical protein
MMFHDQHAGCVEMENILREQVRKLDLQNDELCKALDRDKTGLAAALAAIREEVKGRRWICEGRGPYQYDDDRYRKETGFALDAIEKLAADALAASGKLAHEALTEKQKDEVTAGKCPECGLGIRGQDPLCDKHYSEYLGTNRARGNGPGD